MRKTNEKTGIALIALVMMLVSGCGIFNDETAWRKDGIMLGLAASYSREKSGDDTMMGTLFRREMKHFFKTTAKTVDFRNAVDRINDEYFDIDRLL